jgi:hypothetical protein
MSSKKRKRLEKFISGQLKKEARKGLIEKLSGNKLQEGVEQLLLSSKIMGRSNVSCLSMGECVCVDVGTINACNVFQKYE